jgi:hypothetical protein
MSSHVYVKDELEEKGLPEMSCLSVQGLACLGQSTESSNGICLRDVYNGSL